MLAYVREISRTGGWVAEFKTFVFPSGLSMWGTDRLFLYTSTSQEAFGVSAPDTESGTESRLCGYVPRALPFLTHGMPNSQLKTL